MSASDWMMLFGAFALPWALYFGLRRFERFRARRRQARDVIAFLDKLKEIMNDKEES